MEGKLVSFLVLIGVCLLQVQCQEPCLLHLKHYEHSPVFRPFIYKEDGTLYKSKDYQVKVPHSQVALLSCQDNFFKSYPGKHNLTVKCDDDTLIVDQDKSKKLFKNLNCDLRVVDEVKHIVPGCIAGSGNKGSYYQYFDSRLSIFNVLAEVCYNYETDQVNFIRVQLPSTEPYKKHEQYLPSNTDIQHKVAMLSAYRVDKIMLTLKSQLTEDFDFAHQTVLSVKLLPEEFFNEQLYEVEKFDSNFAGVWSSVAHGNWKRVVLDVQEYTKDKKTPVEVIIGTHGVLKLTTPGGQEKAIYLKDDKVPMPQYLWTIVHNKEKNKSVAIITINNPFIRLEDVKKQMFCDNVCEKVTWLGNLLKTKSYDRPLYGYTFCCSLDNFKWYPSLESMALLKD